MAGYLARRAAEPIPAVAPTDLRGVWELTHKLSTEFAENPPAGVAQPPAFSIDIALLAGACGPGADVFAVSLRSALLEGLVRQGLLVLDDGVFDFAAGFPIPSLDRFAPDKFLQGLGRRQS
jgi:hypothetical protein